MWRRRGSGSRLPVLAAVLTLDCGQWESGRFPSRCEEAGGGGGGGWDLSPTAGVKCSTVMPVDMSKWRRSVQETLVSASRRAALGYYRVSVSMFGGLQYKLRAEVGGMHGG